jgi:DEAD/DEAH box helicase domain-containing protein
MPFVAGAAGKGFFQAFETEHPAFLHQELAWRRCGVQHRSTLVATGTGSGKTESHPGEEIVDRRPWRR